MNKVKLTSKDINDILVGLSTVGADVSELEKVFMAGACPSKWAPALYDCILQSQHDYAGVKDDILRELNKIMAEKEFENILENK